MQELQSQIEDAPGKLYPRECDVQSLDAIKENFEWIEENLGPVSILINNAGVAKYFGNYNRTYKKKTIVTKLYYLYRFTLLLNEGNEEHLAQIVNTNLLGLIYCTKQAYQSMVKHDVEGYIINVGSVFGHALHDMCGSLETFSLYSPSKFALRTATEVLRKELTKLQKHKIRVTVSDTIFFYLCSKQQQL